MFAASRPSPADGTRAPGSPLDTGAIAPEVYDELRRIARRYMRRERPEHTLQPTALVHEALLRISRDDAAGSPESPAFVALAAQVMRRVLVDHARRRNARKRTAIAEPEAESGRKHPLDILALDDALVRLAEAAPRAARVVELRFFAGLEVEDVARVLEISPATVKRDWTLARAWLRRELGGVND